MLYEPKCISCKYFIKEILHKNSCEKYKEIPNDIYENIEICKKYEGKNK